MNSTINILLFVMFPENKKPINRYIELKENPLTN